MPDAAETASRGQLYRAMTADDDGLPTLDESARTLGGRPSLDVPGDSTDSVEPGSGGMSVSLGEPMLLPMHRRPPSFGGTGRDPVFWIDASMLGEDLRWREDPS